jgi:ABC-type sugar transport system permease subunit
VQPPVQRENGPAWLLLSSILLCPPISLIIAMLAGFALGFLNWAGVPTKPSFAGLADFFRFFKDATYARAFLSAFYMGILMMIVNGIACLVGALFLHTQPIKEALFRSIWFLPSIAFIESVAQIFLAFISPVCRMTSGFVMSIGMNPITCLRRCSQSVASVNSMSARSPSITFVEISTTVLTLAWWMRASILRPHYRSPRTVCCLPNVATIGGYRVRKPLCLAVPSCKKE